MIDEREILIEFKEIDREKLDLEASLGAMHKWLEGENHIELMRRLWEKARPDSRMTEFLRSENATPQNIIGLISHLVHNNFLNEYKAVLYLMDMSEEGIQRIINGKEDFE